MEFMNKFVLQSEWYHAYTEYLSKPTILNTILDKYPHVLPWSSVAFYLVMVFFLPRLLSDGSGGASKEKKPTNKFLKFMMVGHNLFLCLLSAAMLIGTGIPYIYSAIFKIEFKESICNTKYQPFGVSSNLFWALLFVYSKFYELLDTLFLIIKNPERPVPFLHYWHHATVLLFTWYAFMYKFTVGFWFGTINGTVHMFMYYYYFLTELGYRPTWAKQLTLLQISQMFAGLLLNGIWAYEYFSGVECECENPTAIMVACAIMYISYAILFLQFFFKRYNTKRAQKENKKEN